MYFEDLLNTNYDNNSYTYLDYSIYLVLQAICNTKASSAGYLPIPSLFNIL